MKILMTWLAFLFAFQMNAQTDDQPVANWPKEIVTEKYTINIYQPQNESYDVKENELISRAAFSIKENDKEGLTFGSMWTNASLDVDRESRMMSLASVEVTAVRFPDEVDDSKVELFTAFMEGEIPKWNIEFPQDELIASLEDVENATYDELAITPPLIAFSNEPAVLLLIDGEPSLKELDKNYERVINTAMFVVKEKKSGKYYLSGGDLWYSADNPLGPWEYEKKVSSKLKKLKKENLPEDAENVEDDLDVPAEKDKDVIPAIVVATKPTELIVIKGEAKFVPIQNTKLLYVENTEADLFMNIETQQYFVLLSGRWFTSSSTAGPWAFLASDQLPEDFTKIPEGSDKDGVLANVAGTDAAQEAKYDAQIPQTAAVDRETATASVTYDGDPAFEKIEGISLQYAVNTSSTVLKSGNKYYLCDNAIWFVADSPTGPWKVADERPEEVDKIPSSNPTYNVKYVYIYETTPSVVYVGYTPGYYGCYVYGPTVVYGTGFYYTGWYGPYYYPRPVTYGFSYRYNPYYGWSMGFGVSFGSPYGWYGYGRGYYGPPYYRPPVYYRPPGGYYGHHGRPVHYNNYNRYNNNYNRNAYHNRKGATHYDRPNNPNTRPTTRPSQPGNRPSQPITKPSQPGNRPSQPTTKPSQPSQKPAQPSTRPAQPSTSQSQRNNVYSDKQGNVQRKTDNGWQQRENNTWSQPKQNNPSNSQMNKSYENRQRGTQRTQNYNQQRSGSAAPSRPSSGSRGGGGRRR